MDWLQSARFIKLQSLLLFVTFPNCKLHVYKEAISCWITSVSEEQIEAKIDFNIDNISLAFCKHCWSKSFYQDYIKQENTEKNRRYLRITQLYLYHMFSIIGLCWSLTLGNQLYHPCWKSAYLLETIFQLKCLSLAIMGSSSFYGLLCPLAHFPFHTQLPPQLRFRLISRTHRVILP